MVKLDEGKVPLNSKKYYGHFVVLEHGGQMGKIADVPEKGPHLFLEKQFSSYDEMRAALDSLLQKISAF